MQNTFGNTGQRMDSIRISVQDPQKNIDIPTGYPYKITNEIMILKKTLAGGQFIYLFPACI